MEDNSEKKFRIKTENEQDEQLRREGKRHRNMRKLNKWLMESYVEERASKAEPMFEEKLRIFSKLMEDTSPQNQEAEQSSSREN